MFHLIDLKGGETSQVGRSCVLLTNELPEKFSYFGEVQIPRFAQVNEISHASPSSHGVNAPDLYSRSSQGIFLAA